MHLFDDTGTEYTGTIRHIGPDGAEIEISSESRPQRESPLRLTLAQAILKGAHTDLVVEKATELGAAETVLFTCERSVVRPPASRSSRWQRIAASAAKQCGRTVVPEILGPLSFHEMIERGPIREPRILFHPAANSPGLSDVLSEFARLPEHLSVAVGPEGGFTAAEVERARRAGFLLAGLGPRVLRAETAAVAVSVLCQFLWGDLGRRP